MSATIANMPEMTTEVVNQSVTLANVRPPRRRLPVPPLLFIGSLLLYWLTRTHLNTFDAVAYANQIGLASETGKLRPLFHPHHLLFNGLSFGVWRLACLMGYGGGPLIVAQSLNAVLGAAGAALYYATLRRLRPVGVLPLLVTLGVCGSFGFWICATDGRVNMPSIVLMIAAFYGLLRLRVNPTGWQAALVGGLAGLALLFHESAGLFGIVGAVGVFVSSASGLRRRRLLAAYGASWVAIVSAAYALVGFFALHLHSAGEFQHWMNAYAERGWWWDFQILHNLRLDLFGLRHAVFVQPLGRAALTQIPLRHFVTPILGLTWLLYGLALLGLTAAGGVMLAALPKIRRSDDRPLAAVCSIWTLLYGAFFTVWCPGAFVFWVPVLIPLGALLMIAPTHLPTVCRRRTAALIGGWVGVYVLLNFLCGILPALKPIAGLSQWVAVDIRAHTPTRSLIVVSGVGADAQCEVDIPYFADRPILSLHGLLAHSPTPDAAKTSLEVSLTRAIGAHRPIYVMGEIWGGHDSLAGLRRQAPSLTSDTLHDLFSAYQLSPAWTGPRGPVWHLSPLSALSGRSFIPPRRTRVEIKGKVDDTKSGAADGGGKN